MTAPHVLVVDDEPDIRDLVREILEDEGFTVSVAANGEHAAKQRLETHPDAVLLDIWMPDIDGITLLKQWRQDNEDGPPVIMMSGHGTVETAVEATRLGAYDFLEKPLSLAKLLLTVRHALNDYGLRRENATLRRHARLLSEPVGKSELVVRLREQVVKVADSDAWVLLSGEPGVGKHLLARYIHQRSRRHQGPFVEVGVSSITPENASLELFGEENGEQVHFGRLEQANGGTLYLNEVADMDPETQTKLLGALQSRSFVRVGGTVPVKIDVRVISSASTCLIEDVRQGRFREQLYYQLNVVPIRLPALREHAEDIPELLAHYVDYFVEHDALPYRSFTVAAQNRLRHYDWPGNIRELRNVVQRLLILGAGQEIELSEVNTQLSAGLETGEDGAVPGYLDFQLPLRQARERFEKAYLEHHLREADGNITQVSKASGIERTHLYRKMKALGVNPKDES